MNTLTELRYYFAMAEDKKAPLPRGNEKSQVQRLDFDAIDRDMSFRYNANFNISAGTVTFHPKTHQVLLILNKKYHEDIWQLPKGRKDLGEDIQATAIRETYEETGYLVKLVPARVRTRATRPQELSHVDRANETAARSSPAPAGNPSMPGSVNAIDDPNTEPVGMVSYADMQASTNSDVIKLCFFYLATLVDPEAAPHSNTQNPGERLEARWMSVADAHRSLRFEAERNALICAATLWNRPKATAHGHVQKHTLERGAQGEKKIGARDPGATG